jgi:replication factor A1
VTAFQDRGQEILGCSARELNIFKENKDPRYTDVLSNCLYQNYLFRLKVKEEQYGDVRQVKNTVAKVERVDPLAESKILLDSISRFIP